MIKPEFTNRSQLRFLGIIVGRAASHAATMRETNLLLSSMLETG